MTEKTVLLDATQDEGLYGSDPPFLTAGAVSRWGGYHTGYHTRYHTHPPLLGGRSRRIYPCGKAPRPARPIDEQNPSGCRLLFV